MTNISSACPLCTKGHFSKERFKMQDMESRELFQYRECNFCGVGQTWPAPEDLTLYYETDTGHSMRNKPSFFHSLLKRCLFNIEEKRIQKCFHDCDNIKIIDIGCGSGDFSSFLREKGYTVYAADSANERPQFLDRLDVGYYNIDYSTYQIPGLNDVDGGLVILRHVLEHIREPERLITQMLEYGATSFYVVLPNTAALNFKFFGKYNALLDPPRHLWHFNKKSLKTLFERLNFKILREGCDTIPAVLPSFYRFLRLKGFPKQCYNLFQPKGSLAALSLPLDWLMPGNVLWMLVEKA